MQPRTRGYRDIRYQLVWSDAEFVLWIPVHMTRNASGLYEYFMIIIRQARIRLYLTKALHYGNVEDLCAC